jgi:hypothetical protein
MLMRPVKATIRTALLGAAAAAMLAGTAYAERGFQHISDAIRGAPSEANYFIATPKGWKQPMTPWGEPDIQARLDMMQASRVPLERCANSYRPGAPPCSLEKKWLTEKEYQADVAKWREQGDRATELTKEGKLGAALRAGVLDPRLPQRETNLLVDPANGLLPPVTPEAKRLALTMHSDWALPGEDIVFDGPTDFDSWDRCITRGMPSSMMPYRYNGGFFIMQSPGHVVFRLEMIHEARIIPTDGRPVPGSAIQEWMGISRGHWEGDTLVVVTDHYKPGPPMINLAVVGSPAGNRFPISEKMKTTERITRLNDDWYLYEITTEDPDILTKPFTVRYPMKNDPSYEMPEYACHEGNTIVPDYVQTNRYERAHPTPEPKQTPVEVSPQVASTLAGTWKGTPRIVTIDDHIELQFTKNADGTVNGKLVGTNFGKIDKPLRRFKIDGQSMSFQFPNIQPWNFNGKINEDGTITGVIFSIQGGMPVTFKRVSNETG